jgi:GR25 family glycosyltransferase involved in LPS biosynthesis
MKWSTGSWRTKGKGMLFLSLIFCLQSLLVEHKRLISFTIQSPDDAPHSYGEHHDVISTTTTTTEEETPMLAQEAWDRRVLEQQHGTKSKNHFPLTAGKKLPVYWMNLDMSTDRKKDMEQNFAMFPDQLKAHRVTATGLAEVRNLWLDHKLELAGSKLVFANEEENYLKHFRGEYVFQEAGCLVSHLSMIRQAYEDGQELALFVEDDAVITEEFLKYHDDYIATAPPGWRLLQWTTINKVVYRQGLNMQDPWISWQPTHWSNVGYTLNREGMENIIKNAHAGNLLTDGSHTWNIAENKMVLADETIYYLSEAPYTSTFPWIGLRKANTTIQQVEAQSKSGLVEFVKYGDVDKAIAKRMPKQRSEKVIVLTNSKVRRLDQLSHELTRFGEEVEALGRWHHNATWIINIVLTKSEDLMAAKIRCDRFASHTTGDIRVEVHVMTRTYNKFMFLKPILKILPEYDYLLVKDSDQRMAGFPWNTFMEKKGEAIVSGPLRETIDDSLFRNHLAQNRRGIQLHYGRNWKTSPDSWESQMLSNIVPIDLPWVEMYFTMFRTDFAVWFFEQVLTDWIVDNPSDFALDLMWCPAALEFDDSKPSCHLLPVISSHEDTRQILVNSDLSAQHKEVYSYFEQRNETGRWLKKTKPWHVVIGSWNLDAPKLVRTCGLKFQKPIPNLLYCAIKARSQANREAREIQQREALTNVTKSQVQEKMLSNQATKRRRR